MSTVTVQVHRSPRVRSCLRLPLAQGRSKAIDRKHRADCLPWNLQLNALIVPDKQGGSSTLKRSDGGSGTPVVFGFPVKGSRSFQLGFLAFG